MTGDGGGGRVRCESESPKSLFSFGVIVGIQQLFLTGEMSVCWQVGGGRFTCARGNVAVMRGCAQVILLMPATARFLREAFVVLVVEKGQKSPDHFGKWAELAFSTTTLLF